jgi:uncharacterized protein (TIGR02466 family)
MNDIPTTTARIDLRSLFATPVAVVRLPNFAEVNEQLRASILACEERTPSNDHSNLGGWQSSWDLDNWGGAAAGFVLAFARQLADRLTVDRTGRPASVDWRMNAWANVNRGGHGNEFHTHPGCYWSGTYYVDDGGIGADPSLGGEFEIQDPRGIAPAMYRPDLAPAAPGCLSIGASEVISPAAGNMIMFPSWLSHAVRPYTGDGTRISIAFNLS